MKNNWNIFSRGICVALLIAAAFCGICGLGAAFHTIPWFWISGAICLLLIISTSIWGLGYMSHTNKPATKRPASVKEAPVRKQAYDQAKEKPGIFNQDNP